MPNKTQEPKFSRAPAEKVSSQAPQKQRAILTLGLLGPTFDAMLDENTNPIQLARSLKRQPFSFTLLLTIFEALIEAKQQGKQLEVRVADEARVRLVSFIYSLEAEPSIEEALRRELKRLGNDMVNIVIAVRESLGIDENEMPVGVMSDLWWEEVENKNERLVESEGDAEDGNKNAGTAKDGRESDVTMNKKFEQLVKSIEGMLMENNFELRRQLLKIIPKRIKAKFKLAIPNDFYPGKIEQPQVQAALNYSITQIAEYLFFGGTILATDHERKIFAIAEKIRKRLLYKAIEELFEYTHPTKRLQEADDAIPTEAVQAIRKKHGGTDMQNKKFQHRTLPALAILMQLEPERLRKMERSIDTEEARESDQQAIWLNGMQPTRTETNRPTFDKALSRVFDEENGIAKDKTPEEEIHIPYTREEEIALIRIARAIQICLENPSVFIGNDQLEESPFWNLQLRFHMLKAHITQLHSEGKHAPYHVPPETEALWATDNETSVLSRFPHLMRQHESKPKKRRHERIYLLNVVAQLALAAQECKILYETRPEKQRKLKCKYKRTKQAIEKAIENIGPRLDQKPANKAQCIQEEQQALITIVREALKSIADIQNKL